MVGREHDYEHGGVGSGRVVLAFLFRRLDELRVPETDDRAPAIRSSQASAHLSRKKLEDSARRRTVPPTLGATRPRREVGAVTEPDTRSPSTRPATPLLVDSFGRVARDLRVSLTEKCSLRST